MIGCAGNSTDEDDIGGQPASFMMVNRNKRGIAIDLKTEDGKAILYRLLADADVFVENHKGGTLDRLGFGYETLHEKYPGLIYCAVSGFGRTGTLRRPGRPRPDHPGHEWLDERDRRRT